MYPLPFPNAVFAGLDITTILDNATISSRNYYLLLDGTSFSLVLPTLLVTTADATIEKHDHLEA